MREMPTPEDMKLDAPGLLDCADRAERECRHIQAWNCMSIIAGLCRRVLAAEEEVTRLQGIINGLSARVAAQAELLAQRAERK